MMKPMKRVLRQIIFAFLAVFLVMQLIQIYAIELAGFSAWSSNWVTIYRLPLLIFRAAVYLLLFFCWDTLITAIPFSRETREQLAAIKNRFFVCVVLFDAFFISNILQLVS